MDHFHGLRFSLSLSLSFETVTLVRRHRWKEGSSAFLNPLLSLVLTKRQSRLGQARAPPRRRHLGDSAAIHVCMWEHERLLRDFLSADVERGLR